MPSSSRLASRTPRLALTTLALSLAACAPATRVTLLPQDNGQPSAVVVTTLERAIKSLTSRTRSLTSSATAR